MTCMCCSSAAEAHAALPHLPALALPLQDMQYSETQGDEVEDLFMLLSYVKEAIPTVTAVCSGAIASDYQVRGGRT